MNRLSACTLVAALVLAGCGTETADRSPMVTAVAGVAEAALARVGGPAPQPVPAAQPTRAEIERYGIPLLRVVINSRGADALVTVRDTKGDVVTWTTTDGTTFTLRDGVLIQTRGLGPDLMSSAAPWGKDLRGDGASHPRAYFFLGDDDQTETRAYTCTVARIGPEVVTVYQRQHRTLHFSETCERPEGKITNDFWFEGATVRKSRQWVSPGTGYAEFEMAVD